MMTLPISNDSIARGIVHRTVRETVDDQTSALHHAMRRFSPKGHRRGPWFRAWVRFMDDSLRGRVLTRELSGKGKAAYARWTFWEINGDPARPVIRVAILDGRAGKLEESQLIRVSQHAFQRLLQRLRTIDPCAAMRELLPGELSAARVHEQAVAHGQRYAVHLRIPTPQGEAVIIWEDEGFLVKTWICRVD